MNPVDLETALWHPGVIIHAYQEEVEMLKATNQQLQQQAQNQDAPPAPTPPPHGELPSMTT